MVTEESSVVAASANAAKFWSTRGGFHAEIIGTEKTGQVHFMFSGSPQKLAIFFKDVKSKLLKETEDITKNMRKRGGGIVDIELIDNSNNLNNYMCFLKPQTPWGRILLIPVSNNSRKHSKTKPHTMLHFQKMKNI